MRLPMRLPRVATSCAMFGMRLPMRLPRVATWLVQARSARPGWLTADRVAYKVGVYDGLHT